jgi:hypothetical protein
MGSMLTKREKAQATRARAERLRGQYAAKVHALGLLTTIDVARRLHVSNHAVQLWRGRGVGPPGIRLGRTMVGYSPDAFEAWLRLRVRRKTVATSCGHCGRGIIGAPPP